MSAPELARPWWHSLPWLAGMALVPAVMILQHWDPCDSTAAIASGNSVLHIALSLLIGFLVGLGVWCDRISSRTKPEPAPRSASLTILTMVGTLLIGWLALATWLVSGQGNLRFAINGFWQWVSMLAWAVSIAWMARRPGFSRLVVISMIAIGVGIVVYGFYEYSVIQPELRRALQRDPEGLFRREGIAIDSSASLLLADRIRSTEMRSVYALANSLGGFLACFWVLMLGGLFVQRPASSAARRDSIWMACHVTILLAIALALLLTKSRTAWLAAGAGTLGLVGIYGLEQGRLGKRMLVTSAAIGTAIIVLVLCIVAWFDALILTEAGKSLAYRFDYWRGACELIAREPWFGFGVGNFQSTYLQVKVATAAESPADPHNFLLEAAHGGGIPFLLLLVLGIGLSGYIAFRPKKSNALEAIPAEAARGIQYLYWSVAIVAACAILAWSLFTASDQGLIGILLAVVAAVATAIGASIWIPMKTSAHCIVQSSRVLWLVFAVVLIHGLASGGWLLPGTMGMALTALGLSVSAQPNADVQNTNARTSSFPTGWLFCGAGLLVFWYVTMALPLSRSIQVKGAFMNPEGVNPTPQQTRDWLKADPHDPELARLGMEWTAAQLSRPMGVEARGEWEELLRELQLAFLERDPQHALAFEACGQASVRAAAFAPKAKGREEWLVDADSAFEKASQSSPASVQMHVQSALAAAWVGDKERSQLHCSAAQEIDRETKHRDRKIEAALVFWPVVLGSRPPGFDIETRRGNSVDFVKAEPVLQYLRSQSKP